MNAVPTSAAGPTSTAGPTLALHGSGWYARRLSRDVAPAEIGWRVREQAVRRAWARRQVRPGQLASLAPLTAVLPASQRRFSSPLPADAASLVPAEARSAVIAAADRLLAGKWELLRRRPQRPRAAGLGRYDPVTGRRSAPDTCAFRLDQRDESAVGNVKQVWELSRLQHLTLLAAAWYLTGDDAYAAAHRRAAPSRGGRRTRSCPGSTGPAASSSRPAGQLRLDQAAA